MGDKEQGLGVPASPSGYSAEPEPSCTVSAVPVSIPNAGNNEPDWFAAAKGIVAAIMFQRGTRGVHDVGKDGRTRMGCVDLLGCYAVDDAARTFCEAAGIEFKSLEPPTEHEAMFMMGVGLKWHDWLNQPDEIRAMAGGTGHRSKVDIPALASAIEARRAATTKIDAVEDESATREAGDAHPITCDPTTPKQEGPNV